VALTLVAATYDDVNLVLLLTFDRAVDIAAFDGSAIYVGDGTINLSNYAGVAPAALDAPEVVRISLTATGPFSYTDVLLDASSANGIIAVDDGGAWAGTGGGTIVLPWP
jgi:hypothetical protein